MAQRHLLLAVGGFTLTGLAVANAFAGPIVGEGDCPRAEDVWTALAGALEPAAAAKLTQRSEALGVVRDDGASFTVTSGNLKRHFDDPTRQCDIRARQAAVVLALLAEETSSAQKESTPLAPAWRIGASVLGEVTPGLGQGWGAGLSVGAPPSRKWRWVAGIVGRRLRGGSFNDLVANEDRAALHVGAELFKTLNAWEAGLSVMASLSWMQWQLPSLPNSTCDAAMVGGVVGQARLAWGRGRWRPVLLMGLEWLPLAPRVRLLPEISLAVPAVRFQPQIGLAVTIP